MILNLKRVKIFFDILTSEGKAVYKSRDICPRELKLEKNKTKQTNPKLSAYKDGFSAIRKNWLRILGCSGI